MKSIEIKKSVAKLTGLELSVGQTVSKNPFICVRTADRRFFPAWLRKACIARIYPGRADTQDCPASYGNIETASIAMKANEWADVLEQVNSVGFKFVRAVEAVISEQKGENFSRVVEELLVCR